MMLLHEVECNAYALRIEFLEETIRNYRSLPADLLGTFDVSRCNGNCEVLRQNFWDVWNTNTSLNAKFESEMQRNKDAMKDTSNRIMELESVNELLERGLSHSNAQLFETRREAVVRDSDEDLEEYFARKLDQGAAVVELQKARVLELEERLYLKEQESSARQMQISYLLSLSNQLEHAAEVNIMRNKLREAEKRIQELSMQRFVVDAVPCPKVFSRVNIDQDQLLAARFRDFFRRLDSDAGPSMDHLEEHMYDQFLLDQPNQEQHKLRPDMYVRQELIQAMHEVCGSNEFKPRRHGVRLCKRDFAACLSSMGGKFKYRRGNRYWVNVGMTRKPLFSWDV